MTAEQYACFSSHFHIVYGLRPTQLKGILGKVVTTRHAAELSLVVLGVEKGILDSFLLMKA